MPEITDERIADIKSNAFKWGSCAFTIDSAECVAIISRLERAEADKKALEAALKEALKYGAPENTLAFVKPLKPCIHNPYWTTMSGECMACRATEAEAERDAMKESVKYAWQSGFELARHYGDNFVHFRGEQKERHWQSLLADIAAKSGAAE